MELVITRALLLLLFFGQAGLAQNTFHGNIARTVVYQSSGPKQFPVVKWAFKVEGPIMSSPAIADGVIFRK